MRFHLFIMLSVFLFSACSSTIFIKNHKTSFNELNNELNNEKVTIIMKNGQEIDGEQVKVSAKTIDWVDSNTNESKFTQLSKITVDLRVELELKLIPDF